MRVAVDLQGAQSGSRFRGIGRYTVSFAKSLIRMRGTHEVLLILSDLFPETIEPLRVEFGDLLPQDNIRVWTAPGPLKACDLANAPRREVAHRLREAFLADLQPDVVHICSLFEGFVEDAAVSIGVFDRHTPVSVTLHDLIPLIHRENYLRSHRESHTHYMQQLQFLSRAAMIFAVSQSTAQDALYHTDVPAHRIKVIHEGVDDVFRPLQQHHTLVTQYMTKFGIHKPFMMYAGGCDPRKNLFRFLKAYSLFPAPLRKRYQIVFVGRLSESEIRQVREDARELNLSVNDLVFTGHVSDEDLVGLYNVCELFVFPSWHEGFGLPVLEAMACGAVVIASNATSLPEIVGREDMLFDPFDVEDISRAMERGLTDEAFRREVRAYGVRRAAHFSWDRAAQEAFQAWEELLASSGSRSNVVSLRERPRLAYISPLPPVRSGISDYSAELLPALSRFYDIEVVVEQDTVTDSWVRAQCPIRHVEDFKKNCSRYVRVLYHLGNSPYHAHMFPLLEHFPGVVVLHDFFLSGAHAYLESQGISPFAWTISLYESHGYQAVHERCAAQSSIDILWKYPCNLPWLQYALGIIVHSTFSLHLARNWYGDPLLHWERVPHLRNPHLSMTRAQAREALGMDLEDFLVCSFGILDPLKLNHKLLEAFHMSSLAGNPRCRLIFVGENHGGDYGRRLVECIAKNPARDRIQITGWVDTATFQTYLAAADVAVQLRTHSRGETSGTILDCLKNALAVIVNAHGSAAELPTDCLWMLPDVFETAELAKALEKLFSDSSLRASLGQKAREHVLAHHDPDLCAQAYYEAIERFYEDARRTLPGLVQSLACLPEVQDQTIPVTTLAVETARLFPPRPRCRHLYVDVSAICQKDLHTGIERVTRAFLKELLLNPPLEWRVEPVYATAEGQGYVAARKFTAAFLDLPDGWALDEPIDPYPQDIFLGLDFHNTIPVRQEHILLKWRRFGMRVFFVVYDLLPVLLPQYFPKGNASIHERWLTTVAKMDGAVCISKAVADEFKEWLHHSGFLSHRRPFQLSYCHLGADFENSRPTAGSSSEFQRTLSRLAEAPLFLMVGTLEPRKGYLQAIQAFDHLWSQGLKASLVIVGQEGWRDVPQHLRRTIPLLVETLRNHPHRGTLLHWMPDLSDESLRQVYQAATCLLMASEGEGFGLPLIEAARYGVPIIARDLPVFREIAGDHAFYFPNTTDPRTLAEKIQQWLDLYNAGRHPTSIGLAGLTWKESAQNLVRLLLDAPAPHDTPSDSRAPGSATPKTYQGISWGILGDLSQ